MKGNILKPSLSSNRMELFRGQSADHFNSMIRKLQGLLQKHGPSFVLAKASETLPSDLKETAFALAADLVFADGSVESAEKQLLA